MKTVDYRTAASLAVSLALCAAAEARELSAGEKVSFEINAPSMVQALMQFTQQSGLQLMVPNDRSTDIPAPSLVGQFTPADALNRLLAGTQLRYEFANEKTVSVRVADAASAEEPLASGGSRKRASEEAPTQSIVPAGNEARNGNSPRRPGPDDGANSRGMPEILVRGKKTLNSDIERTEDDAQPYVVFGKEEIERSQAGTLEEFFRTRLPMNTQQATRSQTGNVLGNTSQIDLRGLGTNQTLILLDGRRMPNLNNSNQGFAQPDINGIPLSAIERIEVLPTSASGIYGGGATGGVINIVTRKDYKGVDFSAQYGNTFRDDSGNYRVDGSLGLSFEDGRTNLLITASHSDSDVLYTSDRDFVARAREMQLANNPAAFGALTTPPFGYTSNIRNSTNANLILKQTYGGQNLRSNFTSLPVGYAGPTADGVAGLIANAGQYNLGLPADTNGDRAALLASPSVSSGTFNLRRRFGERLEAFADVSWFENRSQTFSSFGVPSTVTLPASAPNNPFTTSVVVRFPAITLAFPVDMESETLRTTGGFILPLAGDWSLSADYVWARSRASASYTSPAVGDPDGTGPNPSSTIALRNGTLNVMRDVNAFPLDWSAYLMPSPNQTIGPNDTILKDTNVRLSGPLFDLPGGPLVLSGLIEHREEQAEDTLFSTINESGQPRSQIFFARSQSVMSYYLEARAPLFSPRNASPLLKGLELQVSARRDEYETEAPNPTNVLVSSLDDPRPNLTFSQNDAKATRYTVGLKYSPVDSLTFRASHATGFLPPSITQLIPSVSTLTTALIDPKRGGISQTTTWTRTLNGNPDLVPEDSKSWSFGMVFQPTFVNGLRLSLDYTRIDKDNEIASLGPQGVVDLEDSLPGRVTRGPLSAADIARGYTGGPITAVNSSLLNMSDSHLGAYDAQLDYSFRPGRFGELRFYAVATYQPQLERRALPTEPLVDSAGYSSGVLEWRGNAGLAWDNGPLSIGWDTQYFDSYFVYGALAEPLTAAQATARASTVLSQGSDRIPSQMYHDVFAIYRLGEHGGGNWLKDTQLMLGVFNVFNEDPPILATTAASDGYSVYADARMRRYSFTIRKQF